ncbi:MAG: BlaI/MecI/CopY family transcriptional regulator [Bacteroidota bacterium]
MKELTKGEEQVMQHLWKLEKAFLKDIVEAFSEPRPKYTTVSTVIRRLVEKGFVGYKTYSKVNEYYPNISKEDYFSGFFQKMVNRFFNGSVTGFASFFTEMEGMSLQDLEKINQMISQQIDQKKENDD